MGKLLTRNVTDKIGQSFIQFPNRWIYRIFMPVFTTSEGAPGNRVIGGQLKNAFLENRRAEPLIAPKTAMGES
jgi:hypothetical protein